MKYYNSKTVSLNVEDTITKLTDELKKEGFGIITQVDVKETFKVKLDKDFKNYKILGTCNPGIAFHALTHEDKIGTMLPCNFIVQEIEDGKVEIASINPMVSMQSVQNEELGKIAGEVSQKLLNVLNNM